MGDKKPIKKQEEKFVISQQEDSEAKKIRESMAALAEGFNIIAQTLEPIIERYIEKQKAYEEFKIQKQKELIEFKTKREEKLLQLEMQKEKELKKMEDEYRLLLAQLKHERELKEQKIKQLFSFVRLITAAGVLVVLYFILPSYFSFSNTIERIYPYISALIVAAIAYKEIVELVVSIGKTIVRTYHTFKGLNED